MYREFQNLINTRFSTHSKFKIYHSELTLIIVKNIIVGFIVIILQTPAIWIFKIATIDKIAREDILDEKI